MFENIQFQSMNFERPLNSVSMEKQLKKYGILDSVAEENSFYRNQKDDVDFMIQGDGKTFLPPPLSASAKNHLLYLQVFGLNNAGAHYFTQRKNYDSCLLLYTYGGEGILKYENKEYKLLPGCVCLLDCRRLHFYSTVKAPWSHAILHFNGQNAVYLFEQFYRDHTAVFQTHRSGQLEHCIENILYAYQSNSCFFELKTSHLLEELIIRLINEKYEDLQKIPEPIQNLRSYLERHFAEQLSLDMLSGISNMSKYHLSREFKKYTGFTINEYLISLRLERAKFLLSNTELPITQISQMCGFVNYSNFYNLFRKNTGMIPNEFRKRQ